MKERATITQLLLSSIVALRGTIRQVHSIVELIDPEEVISSPLEAPQYCAPHRTGEHAAPRMRMVLSPRGILKCIVTGEKTLGRVAASSTPTGCGPVICVGCGRSRLMRAECGFFLLVDSFLVLQGYHYPALAEDDTDG